MNPKTILSLLTGCTLALGLLGGPAAQATPITLKAQWSDGGSNGATGVFTIDSDYFPSGGNLAGLAAATSNPSVPSSGIYSLTMTVFDAAGISGVYGMKDFDELIFSSPVALDMSREMVGQSLATGGSFGLRGGFYGDFNLFSSAGSPGAPSGSEEFVLITRVGFMQLTSLAPIPEPASYTMLIGGLGLLACVACRKAR